MPTSNLTPRRSAALSTEIAASVDRARAFAEASKAKATRSAYASDLRDFEAYCSRIGVSALPADPAVVGTYLATLAVTPSPLRERNGATIAVATIRRRMVSIAQAHKAARLPNPIADATVRDVLAGIVRTKTSATRKMDPLTKDRLADAVLAIGPGLKGQRDRAILLLAFACASRQSEIAALDVADLRFDRRGLVVTIRSSKTDQEGKGEEIGVPFVPKREGKPELCAAKAVREWLAAAGIVEGPVFRTFQNRTLTANRIDPDDVARCVRRLTGSKGANIEGTFAGHSLRAGFITSAATTKGVSEADIARVSRHKSVTILRGYIRRASVFEDAPLSAILG